MSIHLPTYLCQVRNKRHILFIPSWFPNSEELTAGNFILEHIRVAAKLNQVSVIAVIKGNPVSLNTLPDSVRITYINIDHLGVFSKFTVVYQVLFAVKKMINDFGKPDITHVEVIYPGGILAWLIRILFSIPYCVTEHWSIFLKKKKKSISLFKKMVSRFLFMQADQISAVSWVLADDISNLTGRTCYVVSNVVRPYFFNISHQESKTPTFIHLSNFTAVKRSIEILQAFIQARKKMSARLIMAGEESELKLICKEISDHSPYGSYIEILNFLDEKEIASLFSISHVLISYSEFETQGITVLEALAGGLQVIVPAIPVFNSFISSDMGITVNSIQDLESAMIYYSQHEFNQEVILNNTAYIYQNHSDEAVQQQLEKLYVETENHI